METLFIVSSGVTLGASAYLIVKYFNPVDPITNFVVGSVCFGCMTALTVMGTRELPTPVEKTTRLGFIAGASAISYYLCKYASK